MNHSLNTAFLTLSTISTVLWGINFFNGYGSGWVAFLLMSLSSCAMSYHIYWALPGDHQTDAAEPDADSYDEWLRSEDEP